MIHHVGALVDEIAREKILRTFALLPGKTPFLVDKRVIDVWSCRCELYDLGPGALFEIVVPIGPGKLYDWLVAHGPSTHHTAIGVSSVVDACDWLRRRKVPLVSEEPVVGIEGRLVNFIHPSYSGILIELIQAPVR